MGKIASALIIAAICLPAQAQIAPEWLRLGEKVDLRAAYVASDGDQICVAPPRGEYEVYRAETGPLDKLDRVGRDPVGRQIKLWMTTGDVVTRIDPKWRSRTVQVDEGECPWLADATESRNAILGNVGSGAACNILETLIDRLVDLVLNDSSRGFAGPQFNADFSSLCHDLRCLDLSIDASDGGSGAGHHDPDPGELADSLGCGPLNSRCEDGR